MIAAIAEPISTRFMVSNANAALERIVMAVPSPNPDFLLSKIDAKVPAEKKSMGHQRLTLAQVVDVA